MREVHNYVDPAEITDELLYNGFTELEPEEAALAGEVISQHRIPFVIDALKEELAKRHDDQTEIEKLIETAHVIYLEDMISDESVGLKYTTKDESKKLIEKSGYFVDLRDFLNALDQVNTSREYTVNLFHTLVLFFLEDDPEMYKRAYTQLRYAPSNSSHYNQHAPSHRYFLRAETLIEYASTNIPPELKIPGVGNKGRKLMRYVLFDEDIDTII